MNSPVIPSQISASRSDTPQAWRARYRSGENGFDFSWPEVPIRQFLLERDRASIRTP